MKKSEFIAQDRLSKIYQHSGALPEKLPPERQLAEEYEVSRFTVRKALEKRGVYRGSCLAAGTGRDYNRKCFHTRTKKPDLDVHRFDRPRCILWMC